MTRPRSATPGRFYLEMNSECSWHVIVPGLDPLATFRRVAAERPRSPVATDAAPVSRRPTWSGGPGRSAPGPFC